MKRINVLLSFILVLLSILPLTSPQVILTFRQQPANIYNLEDIVRFSLNVRANSNSAGILNMYLICGENNKLNFYTIGLSLTAGEERSIQPNLILTKNILGDLYGSCNIEASLNQNSVFSESFTISKVINVNSFIKKTELAPSESLIISGQAIKENGNAANGFVDMSMIQDGTYIINKSGRIINGSFSINFSIPEKTKAGYYTIKLNAYEKNAQDQITNFGKFDMGVRVIQIPTNLRIIFDDTNVEPGTKLLVKVVLYDQTGEKITVPSNLKIIDKNNRIVMQKEVLTDEFFEFPIEKNETPAIWKVEATYNDLTAKSSFNIIKKEEIEINIINRSLIIKNIGNVPYNKTINVRIGGEERNFNVYLKVGESKKYILTAPDGGYSVEVNYDNKNLSKIVALTGNVIDIKSPSKGIKSIKNNFFWIFILLILVFVVFIILKKIYKKPFFGYLPTKPIRTKEVDEKFLPLEKTPFIANTNVKTELTPSIKGEKQDVPIITLNIKNMVEIKSNKTNAQETIQKVINIAEENKAVTYESSNNIFFILSPIKTKTFKNEKIALSIARKIKEILDYHNRMFKQKIIFGISLCYGTIVSSWDKKLFKFIGLGNILPSAKKISSQSQGEILLDEKMNNLLRNYIKTEKDLNSNTYTLKDIKIEDEEHKKFIRKFMDRNKPE